jgi:hypothetical protein
LSDGSTGHLGGVETMWRSFGDCYAGKGLYVLDAESRFNFGAPRFVIWQRGDGREK